MKRNCLGKFLVIWAICLMTIPALSAGFDSTPKAYLIGPKEGQISSTGKTNYFNDSTVVIIGKCNTVTVNSPHIWIIGLYIPLSKKSFTIEANGQQGEHLNVFVRGYKSAVFLGNENIAIQLDQATGIFFWGKKSLLVNGSGLIARCKASDIWITTPDQ